MHEQSSSYIKIKHIILKLYVFAFILMLIYPIITDFFSPFNLLKTTSFSSSGMSQKMAMGNQVPLVFSSGN